MKYLILLLFLFMPTVLLGQVNESQKQHNTIIDFYSQVDSICENPGLLGTLEIICQKKILNHYVTFVGYKDQKNILIAAVTLKPIEDVNKEISLIVNFDGLAPSIGIVKTWGYVFDRNNDGKFDYMALVDGATAFEYEDFPEDFPKYGATLTQKQTEVFINHFKLVFNHWADDNYDGKIDALVHIDKDPDRNWVKQRIVVRSTKFNEIFDDVFGFKNKINAEHSNIAHTSSTVLYHPIGQPFDHITKKTMQEKTEILRLLDRALAECKITKIDMPRK